MRVEIRSDAAAWAWLESAESREQWERLYAECPWASVFQSYAYASVWYDVYRPRFTPLLVGAMESDGSLRGLLPLGIGADGELVAAGARQAEYQVWLARPGDGDAFIEAALERLAGEYPGRSLTFRYLPPDTPRAWLANGGRIARRTLRRVVPRPIWDLTERSATEASLRNPKKYRSRLARLGRIAPVSYERLTDPVAIDALLDEIMPLCDLRHGALHGIMPFGDDPLKAPFHRALARVPGLLCVSVLRCGREVACAGFDVNNRGQVALGFAAFSPQLSRYSPRRIQLMSLGRDLVQQGYTLVDLTPGDDPLKKEWATRFDEAYTLHISFSGPRFAVRTALGAAQRAAKAVATQVGADPARLSARLETWAETLGSVGARRAPAVAARALRRALWSDEAVDLYEFSGDVIAALPVGRPMNRDRVSDLVAYRPRVLGSDSRQAFLRTALKRLEHGAHAFTHVDGGELVACGWVSESSPSDDHEEPPGLLRLSPGSALVHDVMASRSLSTPGEIASVLAPLLRGAAALPGIGRVLVAAPGTRPAVRRAAEQLGGRNVGGVYRRTRAGRVHASSTFAAPDDSAPSPPISTASDNGEQAVLHPGTERL
jgi:CelD/BcsL family acetyltransferase involved in cellulose biosynthesis